MIGAPWVLSLLPVAAAGPAGWVGLQAGAHSVGFRVSGLDGIGRACDPEVAACRYRVFEWYPAEPSDSPPLRFADYAGAAAPDRSDDAQRRAATLRRLLRLHRPTGLTRVGDLARLPEGIAETLDATAFAGRRGATPAEGRFPAVLLSLPGYAPGPQLPLAESLASDGFVVLGIRAQGLAPPPPWELDESAALREMEVEARTVERLLDHALASEAVDPDRVGLLCWSRGGGAAALVQTRRPEVRALVSLDSIVNDENGLSRLRSSPYFDPGGIDVPWVFMTGERPRVDLSLYDDARAAPRHLVRFPRLSHANFAYTGGALQHAIGLPAVESEWGVTGRLAAEGYRAIAAYARAFLASHLGVSDGFVEPRLALEPGFVEVSARAAEPTPPSDERWADAIDADGLEPARGVCERWPERCTALGLLSLADRLATAGRGETAARVMDLAVERHPGEAELHAARAELLALGGGSREEARRAAERALELDPGLDAAREILGWLATPPRPGDDAGR